MLWKFTAKLFYEYNKQNPTLAFFNIIFIIASVVSAYYLPKYYGFLFEIFNKDINKFLTAILYQTVYFYSTQCSPNNPL